MNNYFLLLLTTFCLLDAREALVTHEPIIANQSYTYVVKTNYDSRDQVHLIGHYKGSIIDLKDGIDFLVEDGLIDSFCLIITAEPPTLSQEIISHLERSPQAACLWYDISWAKDGTKTIWATKERDSQDQPTRIPENAIIVYYDPEFIEKIEDKVPQESSTIIHLPTIFLKKNLTKEQKEKRDDSLERSALARIANNSSTTHATKVVKKGHAVKIARTV
jgi:hypothetical protein